MVGRSTIHRLDPWLEWVFPTKCGLCGLLAQSALCESCLEAMTPAPDLGAAPDGPLDHRLALYHYSGRAEQAVKRLKFGRATALAGPMADLLGECARENSLLGCDAIVPVPIHPLRRCWRGFNQSELLAEGMPENLLRPFLLRRVRPTKPQTNLSGPERLRNVRGAFEAAPSVRGLRVLLVDDVLTTGETARVCAAALKERGAIEVGVVAFAAVDP